MCIKVKTVKFAELTKLLTGANKYFREDGVGLLAESVRCSVFFFWYFLRIFYCSSELY